MKLLVIAALQICALFSSGGVWAQQYPQKPIKVIVLNPPGQGTDIITRMYTARLSTNLGQAVYVENRPGAGGTIGAREVAKSPPDGYTLLIGTAASHGITVAVFANPGYDPERDFVPIGMLGRVPMAIAVRSGVGIQSLQDLIAKSKRERVNVALPSTMSTLIHYMLAGRENPGLNAVPYKGSAAAVNDMLGGHIYVLIDTSPAIQPHVASGKFVPVAITTLEPSPLMPGVKTVAQQGFPGFEVTGWFMVFAPKGTPAAIVNLLNAELQKIHADTDFRKQLLSSGFDVAPVGDPARLPEFVRAEHQRWVRIAKESNMRPD